MQVRTQIRRIFVVRNLCVTYGANDFLTIGNDVVVVGRKAKVTPKRRPHRRWHNNSRVWNGLVAVFAHENRFGDAVHVNVHRTRPSIDIR